MKFRLNIGCLVVVLFSWGVIWPQQQNSWEIRGAERKASEWSVRKIPDDSLGALRFFREKINELQLDGYLGARLVAFNFSQKVALLGLGKQYQWMNVKTQSDDQLFFGPVITRLSWNDRPVNRRELAGNTERILRYAEENGYPFASVALDSVAIHDSNVHATIAIDKGPLVLIDSLIIKGEATISQSFLAQYLGISTGDPYNENRIRDIKRRVDGLSFVRLVGEPKVYFSNEGARIVLLLESVNASRFDFVLGVLPGSQTNDGKLLINGQADLSLVNPFGGGRQLALHWENPKPRSPMLDLKFSYPYLFSSPLGVDYQFELFKNDTLYIDITHRVGVSWLYGGGNYFKANFTRKISNLITIDEEAILASGELPEQLDVVNTLTGLEWQFQNLDYRFNPLKGWSVNLSANGGLRQVEPNAVILGLSNENVDFEAEFDSLQAGGSIFEGEVDVSKFWPLGIRSTIVSRGRAGYKYAKELLRNDLYYIGGNRLLRGFDEASIEASLYSIFTLEYRYHLGRNAYVGGFSDVAFIERNTIANYDKSFPIGLGINLAFETGAGIFAVSYAIGKRDIDQPVSLRSGKIHFGYQNYF